MNFKTHANASLFTGYVYGCTLYSFDKIDTKTLIYCILVTYLGGLLPDFDSDNSRSFNIIMNMISLSASFSFIAIVRDPRLIPVSYLIYICFRYQVSIVIQRISRHRSNTHSIIALIACSLATVLICRYFGIVGEWFIGLGLALGYFSHLLLDEINSLYDFKTKKFRVKKSFGTALKLYHGDWCSLVISGIIVIELIIIVWRII